MALTPRYCDLGLATGSDNGTSEANAWQSLTSMASGLAAGDHVKLKVSGGGAWQEGSSISVTTVASDTAPILIEGVVDFSTDATTLATFPELDMQTNAFGLSGCQNITFKHLYIHGTTTAQVVSGTSATKATWYRCKIENTSTSTAASHIALQLVNSVAVNCIFGMNKSTSQTGAVQYSNTSSSGGVIGCRFENNNTSSVGGIIYNGGGGASMIVSGCTFLPISSGGGGRGITIIGGSTSDRDILISGNTFYDHGDSIRISTMHDVADPGKIMVVNNVFSESTDAVDNQDTVETSMVFVGNAYYNIGTKYNGITDARAFDEVDLTADPFVNASSNDFRLNNVSGGGRSCRAAAIPTDWNLDGTTDNYGDVGAMQAKNMIRKLTMAGGGMK
ncbi:MAG: hypothetical protein KJO36_09845 [Acidimicrobiia bacterium]|nr:hypothetical protein [Acidimicrobiia bacterium]